jgi:ParB family transcriptional regulator, chromosome partitioning protein
MAKCYPNIHTNGVTSTLFQGIPDELPVSKIKQSSVFLRSGSIMADELVLSIRQKGLLHPILIRVNNKSQFEVVAGNRRLHACKTLKWKKIACQIVEMDDKEAFEAALIENIQRKSLNPLDEARAFKSYVSDRGWGGMSELSYKIGKSTSYIAKRIKLLDLPPDVLNLVSELTLNKSVAEELLFIDDKKGQSKLAELVRQRRLSSKDVREMVREIQKDGYSFSDSMDIGYYTKHIDKAEKARKSIDKSIATLRIAMSRISAIIEGSESNWIVYEILMQHKNMLHEQIGVLIKEKVKISQRLCL